MLKRNCGFAEFVEIARQLGFQRVFFADAIERLPEYLQGYGKGLYLQLRTDGSLYVGETIDMERRQARHRELGVRLTALAVMPFQGMPELARLEFETGLIQKVEASGYRIANKQKLSPQASTRGHQEDEDGK